MLFIFFLAASTSRASLQTRHKVWTRGGESNPMWTQWRHVDQDGKRDEWGKNERKGSNVGGIGKRDHATKIEISQVAPSLKLIPSKGDPTGLGYKG